MREKQRKRHEEKIIPGMVVEATEGDLGEHDIRPAKVTDVKRNAQGSVEGIEVEKGMLFRTKLEIPANCIQEVDRASDGQASGNVKIDANESELESLTQAGTQTFSPEQKRPQESLLDQIEQRAPTAEGLRDAQIDVGTGSISGQVVAYVVIISTASTIFLHHGSIHTAADAAHALEPLAGPLARYLFAVGLVGSGIVAIPVLLASTSYAVTGAFSWPAGLSKRPWQNEAFTSFSQ
ncbi:MAG: hypothetical protein NVSMB54_22050 [Ktedonobacteraceae bacterium]